MGLFNKDKKLVDHLLQIVEYLLADNMRLKTKLAKREQRAHLEFGGAQRLSQTRKVINVKTPSAVINGGYFNLIFFFYAE